MAYQSPEQLRRERLQKWGTGPTREVRPMLPSNYDATGGRDKWGTPNASIPQYLENNRKMNTMVPVSAPTPAPTSRWQAPGIGGAMAIAGNPAYSRMDRPSTEADAFLPTATQQTADQYTANAMSGAYPSTAAAPRPAMPLWGPSTEADAFSDPQAPSVMPNAWQTKQLGTSSALAAKRETAAERWTGFGKTALDRQPEQFGPPGPMGTASSRVAARREARQSRDIEDQQWGRRIGGFRNRQSSSWAP
jgi:hypothetical protein